MDNKDDSLFEIVRCGCGGLPIINGHGYPPTSYKVICTSCRIQTKYNTFKQGAVNDWNRAMTGYAKFQQEKQKKTTIINPSYEKHGMKYGFCKCGAFVCEDDPICPQCYSSLKWL